MFTVSRSWSTPLAIGSFVLMACTGLLMFFHADSGLNKAAHEWLGWLMVFAVAAHAVANWPAFKRHLLASTPGRAIVAVCVALLAASFYSPAGVGEGASPPVLAMQAVLKAPLTQVAPLSGRSLAEVQAALKAAGVEVTDPQASIASVVGQDRERTGAALRALFGSGGR